MRKPAVLALVVVTLLAIGGIAYASIPGPDGVVHACYKISNPAQGALIAIDSAASCPSGYAVLNWSQTGPQGPAGPQGATGPQGPAGTNGVSGYASVTDATTIPANSPLTYQSATVLCASGKVVLGGGGSAQTGAEANHVLVRSQAAYAGGLEGWSVTFRRTLDPLTSDSRITVQALCATVI